MVCIPGLLLVMLFPLQTLHTEAGNFRAFKIIIAAKYNDVKLNIPEFNAAVVKAKSPSGRAPLLETPSGERSVLETVSVCNISC